MSVDKRSVVQKKGGVFSKLRCSEKIAVLEGRSDGMAIFHLASLESKFWGAGVQSGVCPDTFDSCGNYHCFTFLNFLPFTFPNAGWIIDFSAVCR